MITSILLILFLLTLSAFFSASEIAIISVSRAELQKLKTDGDKKAVILTKLKTIDNEKFIGAILLGNNFVNIAASTIATSLAIETFGESNESLIIATTLMTILVLIYSEILPKTYAVRHSLQMSLKVAVLCDFVTKILLPFTFSIKILVDKILNIIVNENNNTQGLSGLQIIRGAIDLHHEEGEMVTEDKYMLSGIIDLDQVTVEEVMVYRNDIRSIDINKPIEQIIDEIINSPFSRIPLWQDSPENIIGIIHIKDFLKLLQKQNSSNIKKESILAAAREPWFIPKNASLKSQLNYFRERHYHFALVVDEYGELLGLITIENIVEEIVGEIEDEYDIRSRNIKVNHHDNSFIVGGNMTIRDLNRELNWDIDDQDATTIGGLLFHIAQKIPDIDEVFEFQDLKLKVIKKKHNKIIKVKIYKNL